ncbi:MAG: biosynthetic arginine decarboxylase [Bacteroides sp.]|nr:biosynthetic arginine decarboxylase [Bacteroides sp.]
MRKWKTEDSAELYNINSWGKDYFSINPKGNLTVTPKEGGPEIDIRELMDELQAQDIASPVLLRFPDILNHRIEKITKCFERAAEEYHYTAQSHIIYPIKVNQMRPVVEELVNHGSNYNVGLEAGSKPELHAVLSIQSDNDSMIICNGYKDESYIELALLAQKMGRKIFLVVEKLMELRTIATLSKRMNIQPNIGIRIKLASSGSGKWEESGGDISKFGLNSSELFEALELLNKEGLQDCLKLIHFHIGSQVTNIRRIKTALKEAMQFYVQLQKMNYNISFVDIGGGLGVNYDGTNSSISGNSINYSIQEYVNDAIYSIVDTCKKNQLPQPNLIIESGRSLAAHHSILVFEVLASTHLPEFSEDESIGEDAHELVKDLYEIWDNLTPSRLIEMWHDAMQAREEALELFNLGLVDLKTRAVVERLFWSIAREVNAMGVKSKHTPEELRVISKSLADKYFCNFSLFQSLPDSWAIDQIFPIMPLSRLDEKPRCNATLQDITCDSDGKIDNFISTSNNNYHLPVHPLKEGEPYYIGVFLVGAYQEILGDLHNLFGDTNAVHIKVKGEEYQIDKIIEGETIADVLDYVQFDPKRMARSIEVWANHSVKQGIISPEEGREFISNYRSGLYGYTYLERNR